MSTKQPNIIFFFCDDLGWGDVSCLNPDSKIQTANIDALASSGMTFTDAHAGSAVCTPSRYTLLTGRYCWRTELKSGVHGGYSPALITPDRSTVASELKKLGYHTACFGKWHIGMDWALKEGGTTRSFGRDMLAEPENADEMIDFSAPIENSPVDVGFDEYFGISASLDMAPYVFIEGKRATEIPTSKSPEGPTEELRAHAGIAAEGWRHEDVLPALEQRALSYLDARAEDGKPFFLYIPVNGPHTPIVPTEEWKGKSDCGIYGDFVMHIDAVLGSLVRRLEERGLRENTAIFFSSDNGPETLTARYRESYEHLSAWKFRGMKRDNWEGGHRIPYIVSWPAEVAAGSTSRRFVELADFYATSLAMAGVGDVNGDRGEDSFDMLPLLKGEDASNYRSFAVHHSVSGYWAIRRGEWKLLLHSGSGGNPTDGPENDVPLQLYNMDRDPFETENLYEEHPKLVAELKSLCLSVIRNGRSTPGPKLENDGALEGGHWRQLQDLLELEV